MGNSVRLLNAITERDYEMRLLGDFPIEAQVTLGSDDRAKVLDRTVHCEVSQAVLAVAPFMTVGKLDIMEGPLVAVNIDGCRVLRKAPLFMHHEKTPFKEPPKILLWGRAGVDPAGIFMSNGTKVEMWVSGIPRRFRSMEITVGLRANLYEAITQE